MSFVRRYWPVILLFLLPLLALYKGFSGQTIGAFDQIAPMVGDAPAPSQPWDVLAADSALQFYPWRDMVFESWRHGQAPFWNPYELAGTPLLANSQSAGFYPLHILMGVLHVPTGTATWLLAWFHLFWAGLGAYFLTRRIGASRFGSALSGVSFQMSAFMLAWTALPSVITTCAWIPWALGFVFWIFQAVNTQEHRAACSSGGRGMLGLAISVGMLMLGGHLQFAAYGLFAVVFVMLVLFVQTIQHRSAALRNTAAVCVALGLGFCMAAPQILPVLSYSKFSHRQNKPSQEGYQAYVGGAIQSYEIGGLVFPNSLGNPRITAPVNDVKIGSFWPALLQPGKNFAESAIGIGPLCLILLFGLTRGSAKRGLAIASLGALALLIALGTPLNHLFYFWVPGWSATGSPARIAVLFVLCLSALAGLGWDGFSGASKAVKIFAGLALLLGVTWAISPRLPSGEQVDQLRGVIQAIVQIQRPMMMIVVLMIGGIFLYRGAYTKQLTLLLAILIPILLQTVILPPFAKPFQVAQSKGYDRIAMVNDQWQLSYWDLRHPLPIFPPNTAIYGRIHELGGYDSLVHRDTVAMLREINGEDPAPPANGNMMFVKSHADEAKLREAGVSELWMRVPVRETGELSANAGTNVPIGGKRVISTGGDAKIVDEDYQSITIQATGPGTLTLKDRMMPGWSAFINDQNTQIKEGLWRSIELPDGDNKVVFRYIPPAFIAGRWLGIAAWAVIFAGLFAFWRKS